MFGFILLLAIFGYFAYNAFQMYKTSPIGFWDGVYMFFCQGAVDLYYWVKDKIGK